MDERLRQAETLFVQNRPDEAQALLYALLRDDPRCADAYSALGVIAFQSGQTSHALGLVANALQIDPAHKDAVLNLADILRSLGRIQEAAQCVADCRAAHPDDSELLALQTECGPPPPKPEVSEKRRLVFICAPGFQNFLGDIVARYAAVGEVRTCYTGDKKAIRDAVAWADTVWLEWANELTIGVTNDPGLLAGKRVLCRLHSYEALAGFVPRINWRVVDDLIFVAESIRELVLKQVPRIEERTRLHWVPNGVNLDRFTFTPRCPGPNFAFVASLNYKKGPMLLLHAFQALLAKRPDARLHLAGAVQDERYTLYFDQMIRELDMRDRVFRYGHVQDIASWLADKHYIVCTSILESQNMGVMEAMASGIKPLVHNFVGARHIYPARYVWNTIDEFVQMACSEDYNSKDYRDFVAQRYSLEDQLEALDRILDPDRSTPFVTGAPPLRSPRAEAPEPPKAEAALPPEAYDPDPEKRIVAQVAHVNAQLAGGRAEEAAVTLTRLARMTHWRNPGIQDGLVKLLHQRQDIGELQKVFKRMAVAALLGGDLDGFFNLSYQSIYAEQIFHPNPSYRYAEIDEDLNAYTALLARLHPLAQWVAANRKTQGPPAPGEPLRVGFMLEGLNPKAAAIRLFLPLFEHPPARGVELFAYCRFALSEPVATEQGYAETRDLLSRCGATLRTPPAALSPSAQADFLARRAVEDGLHALVYQTTYFVPQFNFISRLGLAPLQGTIDMQQPEYGSGVDLTFTMGKSALELHNRLAPPIASQTKLSAVQPGDRSAFGIPKDAVLLISVNRAPKYAHPAFWRELDALLQRHPEVWFLALGIDALPPGIHLDEAVRPRVVLPGFRDDVMALVAMSDIYLNTFPAGAGAAVIEAMQVGVPVLTFENDTTTFLRPADNMVAADFIGHGATCMPYGDLAAWRAGAERLIADGVWRREQGERMRVEAHRFDPEHVAARFYATLRDELKRKHASSRKT